MSYYNSCYGASFTANKGFGKYEEFSSIFESGLCKKKNQLTISNIQPLPPSPVPSSTFSLTHFTDTHVELETRSRSNTYQPPQLCENITTVQQRNRSNSVVTILNNKVDIESPLIWNDHYSTNDSMIDESVDINRFTLSLRDNKDKDKDDDDDVENGLNLENLESSYLFHHFNKYKSLLNITDIIGLISAIITIYNGRNDIYLLVCRSIVLISFGCMILMGLIKPSWYRVIYSVIFTVCNLIYFLSFAKEYMGTSPSTYTFIYSIFFIILYSFGTIKFLWMVLLNLVIWFISVVYIVVNVYNSSLSKNNALCFILYFTIVFLIGASNIYVLEKSRKISFVNKIKVKKSAEIIQQKKDSSRQLVLKILPEFIINMMKEISVDAEFPLISKFFPECSVLYCDIVEFTTLSSKVTPLQLVTLLNQIFTEFDKVVISHGCEMIKTDGDAFLCAGGLTIQNNNHYRAIVDIATEIINLKILKHNSLNIEVKIRIGVATGSVIGGMIGMQKFHFDLWGEAIALAHTLEQTGCPGKIHAIRKGFEMLSDKYNYVENKNKIEDFKQPTIFIEPNYHQSIPPSPIILAESESNSIGSNGSSITALEIYENGTTNTDASGMTATNMTSMTATTNTEEPSPTPLLVKMKRFLHSLSRSFFPALNTNKQSKQLTDDKETYIFDSFTHFHLYLLTFLNWFVERYFYKHVIGRTTYETRVFLIIGALIQGVFAINDFLLFPIAGRYLTINLYVWNTVLYVTYMVYSFTPFFRKPFIHQVTCFLFLLGTGIITILIILPNDPNDFHGRFPLVRLTIIMLFSTVFHSLNFLFTGLIIICLTIVFFSYMAKPIYFDMTIADCFGIAIFIVLLLASLYIMKWEIRRAWLIRSNVKYKRLLLNDEKEKYSKLLNHILPSHITEKIIKEEIGMLIAHNHSNVVVTFINILGFEKLLNHHEILLHLNRIFSIIDNEVVHYKLEKIKTIGTTYMIAAGLNNNNSNNNNNTNNISGKKKGTKKGSTDSGECNDNSSNSSSMDNFETSLGEAIRNSANMALSAKAFIKHIDARLDVQIGMSVGPCVSGCIGIQRAKYDIWGDTANTASRMQTSAPPGKIQVTKEVCRLLRRSFYMEERGTIQVKGKGEMTSYYLLGRKNSQDNEALDELPKHWNFNLKQYEGTSLC